MPDDVGKGNVGRGGRPAPAHPSTPLEWVAGTGAFIVELALMGTLAVAAHRLADGGLLGWLAGAVAVVALVSVWATWMAPRSGRRLALAGRLLLGCGLVLLAAGLAHLSGLTTWAWWFGGLGLLLTVSGQALEGRSLRT
ncbi:DUF2568 domain-containing protein [Ornithinimicrobium faecis]|uniref:DUF2568 domain-containing protein n=1 Tax=Ornithinimicrobium faecis TaxID=2934158 RepID=UPI0021192583|nr:DUF2568 domain-containing protein [Ornithinimicrobium sp. HY1745]